MIALGRFLPEAWAEDTPGPVAQKVEHIALRFKEAEKAAEKRLRLEQLNLRFYGHLEGSYTQNFNNPSNRINEFRIFDVNSTNSGRTSPNCTKGRKAGRSGNGTDWGFMKFNAGRDSDFIGGVNLSTWADFQEFYVQYLAPVGRGLKSRSDN